MENEEKKIAAAIQAYSLGENEDALGTKADIEVFAAIIEALEKKQSAMLEQLEKRMENKRLKLIYELEDQLNITLPKT